MCYTLGKIFLRGGGAMAGLKYPVLLVHGMGFRDGKAINYWGRIPEHLEKLGCRVFYGGQDSNGTIENNAGFLAERIKQVLEQSGAEKVNVIAHSKGGLDMRYALSRLGVSGVASLTTVSTPHRGSKTMDALARLPAFLLRFAGWCSDVCLRIQGDIKPEAYKVFLSFAAQNAAVFNENTPDRSDVYYQSYAFVMKNPLSDVFMAVPNLIVRIFDGENDGLLSPESAQWGEFRGVFSGNSRRGISHCDEVDMRRRALTKRTGGGVSDITEVYTDMIENLRERGF
ncbi:MAG: esterase/lipase family protein [Oscillospiraceae bacterium]